MAESEWLKFSRSPKDYGDRNPVFPYRLYKPIQVAAHVRPAVLEETAALEDEFGVSVIEPFYRLLWNLNRSTSFMTTHCIGASNIPNGFEWASNVVGTYVLLTFRNAEERFDVARHETLRDEFCRMLVQSPHLPKTRSGWYVRLAPVYMRYGTPPEGQETGFAIELKTLGLAGARRRAAERWSTVCDFVSMTVQDVITSVQASNRGEEF